MAREAIQARLAAVQGSITTMVEYCWMKGESDDWHGVMDAAADIRELLVEQRVLQWVLDHMDRPMEGREYKKGGEQ